MDHTILFSPGDIKREVSRLAEAIDATGADSLLVVAVLKGAAIFSSDLVRAMTTDTELAYITASSYTDDFTPGDTLAVKQNTTIDFQGRDVLIVEDIIDTGRTLQSISTIIQQGRPQSVSTVALVNKTSRRTTNLQPTHSGFNITDEFIYGYGLDWNERFRHLPYIAIANP
jgi:hypoxanthine phosphoribosyltransferase